jgi:hypothetical protein
LPPVIYLTIFRMYPLADLIGIQPAKFRLEPNWAEFTPKLRSNGHCAKGFGRV